MKKLLLVSALFMTLAATAQDRVKCQAQTQKKEQCKNFAIAGTNLCRIHSPGTPRCGALTSKKEPCKVIVKEAGLHCWRHQQQ